MGSDDYSLNPPILRHFDEIGFSVEMTEDKYVCKFRIVKIDAICTNGARLYPGPTCSHSETEFAKTETFLEGGVKWDGCSHWNTDACWHFCERDEFAAVSAIMSACYDWAASVLNVRFPEMWPQD